jgi:hypothetical protein
MPRLGMPTVNIAHIPNQVYSNPGEQVQTISSHTNVSVDDNSKTKSNSQS